MSKINLHYLAGFFDGEGSFSLTISKRGITRPIITFSPIFRVGLRYGSWNENILRRFMETTGVGKIYRSGAETEKDIISWQSTNWFDIKEFCELIIPFLDFKKPKAKMMLKAISLLEGYDHRKRFSGELVRPKEVAYKLMEISLNLNSNDSSQAAKRKKEKGSQYSTLIEKVYKYRSLVPMKKNGAPLKYTDKQILEKIRKINEEGYVYERDRKIKALARYRFGSWNKALELCKPEKNIGV